MSLAALEHSRIEVKFVGSDVVEWRLRGWLRTHRAGFRTAYPQRRVNNIYFDTYDYGAFWENLTGVSERTKIRYRWYGDSLEPGPGALELKGKRNSFGWKQVFRVAASPYTPGCSWSSVRGRILADLPDRAKLWLEEHPLPVIINSYQRDYFVSADGRVRVTLDLHQTVRDQRFACYPNLTRVANLPGAMILEVKCARKDRDSASSVIQGIPIRVSRHSKYVTGVRAVSEI